MSARKGVTLADRVRQLRKKKGLTQLELSQRAAVRPETISRIERGGRGGLASLAKVARALDTTVDALIAVRLPPKPGTIAVTGNGAAKVVNGNGHRKR